MRISFSFLALAFLVSPLLTQPRSASADPEEPSLRHMIGQMLLVGFVGSSEEADGYRTVLQQAFEGKIGGVLYLGRNIRSLDSIRRMNEGLQGVSGTRLLIAIDQEGGHIERLTNAVGFEEIPSAASVSETLNPDAAKILYKKLGGGLASLGSGLITSS